jgi:putative effector of murein hydrolase
MSDASRLWVYLAASPLLWLAMTLLAYAIADRLSLAAKRHPLVNPVLIAVTALSAMLWASGTPYATYFEGAQFVHFLLGPATVALAIPLHRNWPVVRRAIVPILAALEHFAFRLICILHLRCSLRIRVLGWLRG